MATGEAEAIRIKGDAEAYKLNVIAEALRTNPNLLTLEQIQKWNGVFPNFFSGNGESPNVLLNIPTTTTNP